MTGAVCLNKPYHIRHHTTENRKAGRHVIANGHFNLPPADCLGQPIFELTYIITPKSQAVQCEMLCFLLDF